MMKTEQVAVMTVKAPALSQGFTLAFIANFIWGTSFLASKYTLLAWGPLTASVLRFLVAVVGLFIGFKLTQRKIQTPVSLKQWGRIGLVAFSGFGLLYPLQLSGLKLIPSGLSASIMLTSPVMLVALGFLVFQENISRHKVWALTLGVVGGLVLLLPQTKISAISPDLLAGSILTFVAAFMLALSVIATRRIGKSLDSGSITFWSMLIGLVLMAPFSFFETQPSAIDSGVTAQAVLSIVYLGLVCSALCFLIWNKAISVASPKEIAGTMHIKTPVAIILGLLVAGENLTLSILVGSSLVAVGVWLSQADSKKFGGK